MTIKKAPAKKPGNAQDDPRLAEAIIEYADLKSEEAKIKARLSEVKAVILDRQTDETTSTTDGQGHLVTSTIVQGETMSIDEGALKKALGTSLWTKISTRFLDRKKLDAAVASGEVDSTVVAKHTEFVPKAPYPLVSRK